MQREFSFLVQLRVRFEEGEKGDQGSSERTFFDPSFFTTRAENEQTKSCTILPKPRTIASEEPCSKDEDVCSILCVCVWNGGHQEDESSRGAVQIRLQCLVLWLLSLTCLGLFSHSVKGGHHRGLRHE